MMWCASRRNGAVAFRRSVAVAVLLGGAVSDLHAQVNLIDVSSRRPVLLVDFGRGLSDYQAHAFDPREGLLYVLQHKGRTSGPARVSRYRLHEGRDPQLVDQMAPTNQIGHQTLSLERTSDGKVKVWAAAGPRFTRSIVRFDYVPNGAPGNIETIQLFDPNQFSETNLTGGLSPDGKIFVARSGNYKNGRSAADDCIGVFQRSAILDQKSNDEPAGLATWCFPKRFTKEGRPISPQAVQTDGSYVYLFYGPRGINEDKVVQIYDLKGNAVQTSILNAVGLDDARRLSEGQANEWEGANFTLSPAGGAFCITLGMIQGGPVYYKRIYLLDAKGASRRDCGFD